MSEQNGGIRMSGQNEGIRIREQNEGIRISGQDGKAGKIKLAANTKPALSPGTWRITAAQTVSGDGKLKDSRIRSEELVFSCEADPYAMDPDQVYSVYPPKDSFGMFETTLPNMVLKRRTLPWERTVPGLSGVPWLALLLFAEDEEVSLKSVKRPNAEAEERYMELTVPADLFKKVCPSAGDLKLAVHSRFTDREDKVTEKKVVEDWMSVVACGRLPKSGTEENGFKNTVYLVSMEGAGDYLKMSGPAAEAKEPVRLPVLSSWSFYSKKEEYNFRTLFEGLKAGPLAVRTPPGAGPRASGLLERGYIPMNHNLRDGGCSVSWYHGPFRPWDLGEREQSYQLFSDAGLIYEPELGMFDVSVAAAFNLGRMLALKDGAFAETLERFREENKREAAVRQNRRMLQRALSRTGTLKAAGQAGWNLAEAGEVSTEGTDGRYTVDEESMYTAEMKILTGGMDDLAARLILGGENARTKTKGKAGGGENADADRPGGGPHPHPDPNSCPPPCPPLHSCPDSPPRLHPDSPLHQRTRSLVSLPSEKDRFAFLTSPGNETKIPEVILDALSKWSLLYDVPYRYLVPNPKLLPQESIRFFYMDHDWLTALLDGAMSLGRLYDVDYEHDSELIERILEQVFEKRLEIRPLLQGKRGEKLDLAMEKRRMQVLTCCGRFGPKYSGNGIGGGSAREDGRSGGFPSTGFLLRSEMVSGWRGLEFRAYADLKKEEPLTALRLETLAPDVLLGIFAGECACLEIGQPPEGMHFGFEKNPGGGYRKLLRSLDDGALYDKTKLYAGVTMRNPDLGVINWEATASNIKNVLPAVGTPSSAHMALEMIQNPASGDICRIKNS